MLDTKAKNQFEKFLEQPDNQINLAQAALMVARLEYPDLDINTYMQRIHALANEIRNSLPDHPNAAEILSRINQVLFIEEGFEGNSSNYYDPRNSFLNDVLDRKLGIPVSLSILYMELASELGVPLDGVSFPGHFLVKLEIDDGAIVLDPYFGGISLTEEDLEERIQEYYGEKIKRHHYQGLLATSSKKEIIVRVMRNLRNLYMEDKQWEKALTMADTMVGLDTDKADAVKARALIYDRLECCQPALRDYKEWLRLDPANQESQDIRKRVSELSETCRHVS
ncbi:MAG: Transglut core2 protein [Pseudomonadota bacterium]|nr:Transglut core2 protein [Pseudomonadota bacterium]